MTNPSPRLARLLEFIDIDPRNPVLRLDAIREAFAAADWEAARRLLDGGLQEHPGEPRLQELLAFTLFMQRRYTDALEKMSDGSSPLGMALRARCLHHLRRPDEAIADLESRLHISPEDAESNGLLALLLYERDRSDRALGHVETALRQNPQQVEALLTLASIQSDAQQLEAARATFDTIVRVDSRCGRAWLGLALLDLRENRLDAAKRHGQAAAATIPDHIGTWHVLSWTYIMLGEIDSARDAFEHALSVDRTFGETHGGLAVIAALQNRDEEARLGARRALRLDPQSLSPKYAEILLLQHQGRHDDAKAVFDAVLSRPAGGGDLLYRDLIAARMRAPKA